MIDFQRHGLVSALCAISTTRYTMPISTLKAPRPVMAVLQRDDQGRRILFRIRSRH